MDTSFNYLAAGRLEVVSQLPLAEVLFDFYDRLKTVTQGYGSFDYDMLDYRPKSDAAWLMARQTAATPKDLMTVDKH